MRITPVTTRLLYPPQDELLSALREAIDTMPEQSVLAVTSKVVSVWQGRCVVAEDSDKDELIQREADQYIPRDELSGEWVTHTLKNNLLVSSAGIDHSNGDAHYILWPQHPYEAAGEIRSWIQSTYGIKHVGVVITDSRSVPLRRGAIGMSLGHAGFKALRDYRGEDDLFGDELKVSMANIVDAMAASGTLVMGEGNELTPAAIIDEIPSWYFKDWDTTSDRPYSSLDVPPEEDMFFPLFGAGKWRRGRYGA